MLRVGVISDTHRNLDLMRSAASELREVYQVSLIIHLGDYLRDALELRREGHEVWAVPGTACPGYGGPDSILRDSLAGLPVVCAHTPDDLRDAVAPDTRLAMHGHTHAAFVEQRGGTVWLNPGHLKAPLDRGHRPSYALIEVEPGLINVCIQEPGGLPRQTATFKLPMESSHA